MFKHLVIFVSLYKSTYYGILYLNNKKTFLIVPKRETARVVEILEINRALFPYSLAFPFFCFLET